MTTEHTKTPWSLYSDRSSEGHFWVDAELNSEDTARCIMRIEPGENVSEEETRANIEHFIACVNATAMAEPDKQDSETIYTLTREDVRCVAESMGIDPDALTEDQYRAAQKAVETYFGEHWTAVIEIGLE